MSENRPSGSKTVLDVSELIRLNEELRRLRESIQKKKQAQQKARSEGKGVAHPLDLTQEIRTLNQFLTELARIGVKIRMASLAPPQAEKPPVDLDLMKKAVLQMRSELEKEKKIEEQSLAAAQERLKQEHEEVKMLKDELLKARQILEQDRKLLHDKTSLEPQVSREKEELENLKSSLIRMNEEKKKNDEIQDLKESLLSLREELQRDRHVPGRRLSDEEKERKDLEETRAELQRMKEDLERERKMLETTGANLDEEKRKADSDQRALDDRSRELEESERRLKQERQELEQTRLMLGRARAELERRNLDRDDAFRKEKEGNDRIRDTILKIKNELQSERQELGILRKSLAQLKEDNMRARRRLEKERESLAKAEDSLERERRKVVRRELLLKIKEGPEETKTPIRKPQRKVTNRADKKRETTWSRKTQGTMARTLRVRDHKTSIRNGAISVLGVKLGDGEYGIEIGQVREIIKKREITPVPRQPYYVEGVINVRGTIIPVVNLKKRFKMSGEDTAHPHIIIVETGEDLVGMLVDTVSEVVHVPSEEIHPPPSVVAGIDSNYLQGICRLGERLIMYLDAEKVLREAVPTNSTIPSFHSHVSAARTGRSLLDKDDRKVLKATSRIPRTKKFLQEKTGLSIKRLDRVIASLSRKGLIEVATEGNRKAIRRTEFEK